MMRQAMGLILAIFLLGSAGANDLSPLVIFTAMSGRPDANTAREIVTACTKAGFSQWLVYPRSGLEIPYLGEEWFAFMGSMLREAKAVDGRVWLYDEYNWPSGSCRGRVPQENPAWTYSEYAIWSQPDGAFRWEVRCNDSFSMYDKYFDVNAYSEGAIRRFIELTHRAYYARFADYFRDGTIPAIFTDEPGHPSVMDWKGSAPLVHFRWWDALESQYRAATGRDFRADVEASLKDPSQTAVWEMYTELKGRQFRRAYFDQIDAWCRSAGILSCGHMIAENDARQACDFNGLPLETIQGLSLPGIDKIRGELGRNDEWLTYLTGQYGLEHRSTSGDLLTCSGGVELFACGPCDLTPGQLAQRIWTAAFFGFDTYYLSLYHNTARGFFEKGGWAMFMSPTQPYFNDLADLHEAARAAAKFSRRRPVRDIAVRYPQRVFGRLALGRAKPGEKAPPLESLVGELLWHQLSCELVQEDEPTNCRFVLAFDGALIREERTGQTFGNVGEAREWLGRMTAGGERLVDVAGHVVPGVLVRRFADGSSAALNLTRVEMRGLQTSRGDTIDLPVDTPVFLQSGHPRATDVPQKICASTEEMVWRLDSPMPSLRRIWFNSNGVARLTVTAPLSNVVWAICQYPTNNLRVSLNGSLLAADRPCAVAPFAYRELYRETAPMTLLPGDYELRLAGRADDIVFLPALWLSGRFVATEPGVLRPREPTLVPLGPLAAVGWQDFAGEVTYSAELRADSSCLALATGGLVARVRVDGVDLGTRAISPFVWRLPPEKVGRHVRLDITLVTSIAPVFGRSPSYQGSATIVPDVALAQRLWCPTLFNAEKGGLLSLCWLRD